MKTKTVTDKFKDEDTTTYKFNTNEKPDSILGCWIINHKFEVKNIDERVVINGSYDINIWYSYDNDSKTNMFTKTMNCEETLFRHVNNNSELIISCLKEPSVIEATINNDKFVITISKIYGIEVIDEVEVIEDKPKTIEKLNSLTIHSETYKSVVDNRNKINEIIDRLNELLEKSDK